MMLARHLRSGSLAMVVGAGCAAPAATVAPAASSTVATAPARHAEETAPPKAVDVARSPARFPEDWVGVWEGEVVTTNAAGPQPPFGMELHIAPTQDPAQVGERYTWTIVYALPSGTQTRPYELRLMDGSSTHVQIDEKNGIVIDGFVVGTTLYTQFSVSGSLLTITYARHRDELWFDVLSTQLDPPRQTGGGEVPPVSVYLMQSAQHGVLRRR